MPDTKISALPAVTTPAGTDEFAVAQGGSSKKISAAQLGDFMGGRVLDSELLAVAAATIDLTWTGSYRRLFVFAELTGLSASGIPRIQFNGVTTASQYGTQKLYLTGTAVADAQVAGTVAGFELYDVADTNGAIIRLEIRNIASEWKTIVMDGTKSDTASIGQQDRLVFGGAWNNTTNEITSIRFLTSAGNYLAGTRVWVMGY